MSYDNAAIVAQGGVAAGPVAGAVPLLARAYTHPVLEDRTVVRLVHEPLREVEDLSLAVLGMTPAGEEPVGYARPRAVGFPAWPIIHDPANARHALNLVAELKRAAKLARVKLRPAKDLIDDLAARLGASAPHFLPTFLEEAARVFLAVGNASYAAQSFSKARQAERTYALPVDEERHRAVLLEFALAGALNAKELTNESKSLLERASAQDALELFIRLNVDRVRGGLPPYAGMSTDLRRLIRAAGADRAATEAGLLVDLLGAPALAQAPMTFWKTYLRTLKALGRQSKETRAALAAMVPEHVPVDDWVGVLEATGVADALRSGEIDARDWVTRYVRRRCAAWDSGYPRKLSLLVRELPGLTGVGISLHRPEPELVDALLSAGMSVTLEVTWSSALSMDNWAEQDTRPGLEVLAASEHAGAAARGVGDIVGSSLNKLLEHAGTRSLLHTWARSRLTDTSTLLEVEAEYERLEDLWTPRGIDELGEELDQFTAHCDGDELLATALRGGLLTELTWPTLEAVSARLQAEAGTGGGQEKTQAPKITFHEAWPAVGVACAGTVVWVDGDKEVATASFAPPKGVNPEDWKYTLINGVTGCLFNTANYDGYSMIWSNDPGTIHDQGWFYPGRGRTLSFPVPEGRLTEQGLQRIGDSQPLFDTGQLFHDGRGFWREAEDTLEEVDPDTGHPGRRSLPTRMAELIEPHLREGYALDPDLTFWMPTLPTTEGSLLGAAEGLHTWVAMHDADTRRFLDLSGRVLTSNSLSPAYGRLERPGGGTWIDSPRGLALEADGAFSDLAPTLDAGGRLHLLHHLPQSGWHQLRVRDAAVSARLRAMTPADVAGLLEAAPSAPHAETGHYFTNEPYGEEWTDLITPEARGTAERLLGTTDPALVDAVVWLAARVKRLVADVNAARARAQSRQPIGTFGTWAPNVKTISWTGRGFYQDQDLSRSALMAYGDRLNVATSQEPRAEDDQDQLCYLGDNVLVAITHPEVLLVCAAAPMHSVAEVCGSAGLLGAIVDSGMCTPLTRTYSFSQSLNGHYNIGDVVGPPAAPGVIVDRTWKAEEYRTTVLTVSGTVPDSIDSCPTTAGWGASGVGARDVVAAFERLLTAGPPSWDRERAERLAEGTGWSYAAAALLMACRPGIDEWSRNFLPKELRALLGLKVAEADAGRQFLRGLDTGLLVSMISAGARDPMQAVAEGLDVEAMIAYWAEHAVHGPDLDEELFTEIDTLWQFGEGARQLHHLLREGGQADTSVPVMLWLAARLRRDDPARTWLADQMEAHKRAVGTEAVTMHIGTECPVRSVLGLPERTPGASATHTSGAWTVTGSDYYDEVTWNPQAVTDWEAEKLLIAAIGGPVQELRIRADAVTGTYDAVMQDLRVAGAGFNQDPLASAPEVVDQVVAELGLDQDQARYWLQILTLADPTDEHIQEWNDWGAVRRQEVAAALVERGLLVEAQRERSGRNVFLPGGWREATIPNRPMEVWKAPLYHLEDYIRVRSPLGAVVAQEPLGTLFTRAWERYRSGDVPAYVELRTERRRRR